MRYIYIWYSHSIGLPPRTPGIDAMLIQQGLIIKKLLTFQGELLPLHCLSQVSVLRQSSGNRNVRFGLSVSLMWPILLYIKLLFLLFVAECNGACTTCLSLSAMLPKCQQTMCAHQSHDHVICISLTVGKASFV